MALHRCLITAAELGAMLGDPATVVVDCRFDLLQPEAGAAAWLAGRVPGARYAHLDHHLAAPPYSGSGRHPLPDPQAFAARLGAWGIGSATRVIAYDAAGGAIAARLWWLLRWVGHEHVALLDGGFPAWVRAGLPLEEGAADPVSPLSHYPVRPGSMPTVTTPEVEAALGNREFTLLDARDAQRFAGAVEPIDPVAGHVPGALNWPFSENLRPDGRFLPAAALRTRLQQWLPATAGAERPVVSMCGSGVTACHTLFALDYAGLAAQLNPPPALYVGSWSEWVQVADRPVARGANAG